MKHDSPGYYSFSLYGKEQHEHLLFCVPLKKDLKGEYGDFLNLLNY